MAWFRAARVSSAQVSSARVSYCGVIGLAGKVPGKGDGGQAELCVRRKIALAVLAESWWKNSNLFVKTDGGRAKT